MSADPLDEEEDQYISAEDSDFAPDDAPGVDSEQSDSENEGSETRKRKPIENNNAGIDDGNNSGDDAIIKRGKKKLKRSLLDEDGGEGGLIKTRRQRAAEKEEKALVHNFGPVTIDVDALWAQMTSGKPITPERPTTPTEGQDAKGLPSKLAVTPKDASPTMIRIKRTYNFAGRVHTEEKMVAKDSAEAKLYLASQSELAPGEASPPKRITKKAFRSAFEPVIDNLSNRTDLNLGMTARMQAAKDAQAKKLNTVEKSRMDWAGYVDKEGIKDELELAGKSKDSYTMRQDFLARSEAVRNEESRKARLAGRT